MLNRAPGKYPPDDAIPRLARGRRLQWEASQGCTVLLYAEGMVKLNASAAEILELCDGRRNFTAILAQLRARHSDADLEHDVREFLEKAHDHGWIEYAT